MSRIAFAVVLALPSACAPAVDATFSDVEVLRPSIAIPAAPPSAPTSVTFSFTFDSSRLGATANPAAQDNIRAVHLHRMSLTAKSGVTDLAFISSLHALACVPVNKSSTLSTKQVEIADYVRLSDTTSGATFDVPILEPVDLLPLLRPTGTEPRSILVIVNLGGRMPTVAWNADVSLALSLEIRQ